MKLAYRFLLGFAMLAMLLMPANVAFAKGLQDGKVVFGDNYTLTSGNTLSGDLVVMGGAAEIQAGALVEGSVVIMGGSLNVSGTIQGDLVLIGGVASLTSTAVVEGDVVTIGGSLQKDEGATIKGEIIDSSGSTIDFDGKSFVAPFTAPPAVTGPQDINVDYNPLRGVAEALLQALLLGLLAALVVVLLPNATNRVGNAITSQPVIAGGLGCLTLIIVPIAIFILVLLSVFIITIPITISLIGIIAVALAAGLIFGAIGIGLEVGKRLTRAMRTDLPDPLEAAIGTFLVVLVVNGVSALLFCFGWWAPVVFYTLALGGVAITRFGTQAALPPQAPVYAPPAPTSAADDEPLPPAN